MKLAETVLVLLLLGISLSLSAQQKGYNVPRANRQTYGVQPKEYNYSGADINLYSGNTARDQQTIIVPSNVNISHSDIERGIRHIRAAAVADGGTGRGVAVIKDSRTGRVTVYHSPMGNRELGDTVALVQSHMQNSRRPANVISIRDENGRERYVIGVANQDRHIDTAYTKYFRLDLPQNTAPAQLGAQQPPSGSRSFANFSRP